MKEMPQDASSDGSSTWERRPHQKIAGLLISPAIKIIYCPRSLGQRTSAPQAYQSDLLHTLHLPVQMPQPLVVIPLNHCVLACTTVWTGRQRTVLRTGFTCIVQGYVRRGIGTTQLTILAMDMAQVHRGQTVCGLQGNPKPPKPAKRDI